MFDDLKRDSLKSKKLLLNEKNVNFKIIFI